MLALPLLALAATASAFCVDLATVRAAESRLAAIKAANAAECTSTCAAFGNTYAYYAPGSCYCAVDLVHGSEGVPAPSCGNMYEVTRTYVPPGKLGGHGRDLSPIIARSACPKGQMQCNTAVKAEWECLDVNATVSSCGGCALGLYGIPESAGGEDCNFVPGVAPGGARCNRGRCQATACIDGWSVRENARERGDTACIYHVYGGAIFRGEPADEEWIASHIKQWSFPTVSLSSGAPGATAMPFDQDPATMPEQEYMQEGEVLALIADVQRERKEKGESPLPVQAKAEASVAAAAAAAQAEAEAKAKAEAEAKAEADAKAKAEAEVAPEKQDKAAEPPRDVEGLDTAVEDTPSVEPDSAAKDAFDSADDETAHVPL